MADAKVQIGLSTDFLEGTSVNTPAGENLFREGVVISDPEVAEARARITNTAPQATDYGLVVRMIGNAATTGAWGYLAGSSGTVSVPTGGRVLQISATSTLGGSFKVNNGTDILIPANQQFTLEPRGNLVAPTVEFVNTTSYVVEFVS